MPAVPGRVSIHPENNGVLPARRGRFRCAIPRSAETRASLDCRVRFRMTHFKSRKVRSRCAIRWGSRQLSLAVGRRDMPRPYTEQLHLDEGRRLAAIGTSAHRRPVHSSRRDDLRTPGVPKPKSIRSFGSETQAWQVLSG